ncbi:MAG: EAL domain-containing protein [Roseibium sp.]
MSAEDKSDTSGLIREDAMVPLARQLSVLNQVDEFKNTNKLDVTHEWLQALVNHVSDYVFVKDRHSRFVVGNDRVATDIGFKGISDLIGKSDWELHTPEVAKRFFDDEQTVMETGVPLINREEIVILSNGKTRWFAASKHPIFDENGEVVGIVGASRDITQRKRAQLLQNGQNKVLQEIATGAPLATVLETLVLSIEEQLDGVLGSVMLMDETGKRLLSGVAPNLPEDYTKAIDGLRIGPSVGSCGTAAYTRKNVFVDNLFESELWANCLGVIQGFDLKSCWSVPILSRNSEVLGTFGLYTNAVRSATAHELQIAEEAARLASIAIERDNAEKRIRYLAHHDPLTGLPNRQEFDAKLEEQISLSRDTGDPFAIVFVDMDNFKFVNDSFGHETGDKVLKIVAERITEVSKSSHQAIRFGGDEFVLIIDGPDAAKTNLKQFMEKLRAEMTKTIRIGGTSFHVTCSLGAAVFPNDADNAETLLRHADGAMFEAKALGRNSFFLFEKKQCRNPVNKLALLEDMRSGIDDGQFFLEYQPQFDLMSGRIVGVEALARWLHPHLGLLMPAQFIELAEESGLIIPLGLWVLKEACRQNKSWQMAGLTPVTVGVNVSVRQFRDMTLLADAKEALAKSGLEAKYLELELTESLLIQNAETAVDLMEGFRNLGVNLAIDDFGTGYSSLAALKDFPLTRLKIDRSFIRDLDHKESDRSIARAIISLGRELGLNVVAEGVETAKQQAFLASCQCETVQGFHFCRPMSSEKLERLLAMTLTQIDVKTHSIPQSMIA